MDYAGPLWLGNIFDPGFIESMMKENKTVAFRNSARITKLLTLTKDEAQAPITYYVLDKLSGKLGLPSPSIQAFIECLRKSGFQAVQTHFNTRGVRTDAPATAMHKLLKEASGQLDNNLFSDNQPVSKFFGNAIWYWTNLVTNSPSIQLVKVILI